MRKKSFYLLILVFIIFFSSCFTSGKRQQSINTRLAKNKQAIEQTDTTKIYSNGIYLSASNDPQNNNVMLYAYLKFYPGGKVFESKIYKGEKPTDVQLKESSEGNWYVYYITDNNLFIEEYDGGTGYRLHLGVINKDSKGLTLFGYRALNDKLAPTYGMYPVSYIFQQL